MGFKILRWWFIVITGICLSQQSYALDENEVIDSAERVVYIWAKEFKKGMVSIFKYPPPHEYWKVKKFLFKEVSYDIKKTNSIVSPYKLIISFGLSYADNTNGPNVNGYYSKNLEKTFGYATQKDALENTKNSDFGKWDDMDSLMTVYYAFQKNKWIFKGANKYFILNFIKNPSAEISSPEFLKTIKKVSEISFE